jgi:hypothetical protein
MEMWQVRAEYKMTWLARKHMCQAQHSILNISRQDEQECQIDPLKTGIASKTTLTQAHHIQTPSQAQFNYISMSAFNPFTINGLQKILICKKCKCELSSKSYVIKQHLRKQYTAVSLQLRAQIAENLKSKVINIIEFYNTAECLAVKAHEFCEHLTMHSNRLACDFPSCTFLTIFFK